MSTHVHPGAFVDPKAQLGVDVNVANTDGRTALDAAQALKYESVVKFLVDTGAKSGAEKKTQAPGR